MQTILSVACFMMYTNVVMKINSLKLTKQMGWCHKLCQKEHDKKNKTRIASFFFHCKNLIMSKLLFYYVRHCSVNHVKMTSSKGLNQHGTTCYTTLEPYWFCKCFLPPYHSETTTFVNPELSESLLVFHSEAERWHCNTLHSTFEILFIDVFCISILHGQIWIVYSEK